MKDNAVAVIDAKELLEYGLNALKMKPSMIETNRRPKPRSSIWGMCLQ